MEIAQTDHLAGAPGMNLYFFSGTGNSLFVARELQKRFPETALIPIACLLDREVIAIEGETVGLVFPIHGMSLPIPIRLLLEKATWASPRYVFAIATRGGTVFTGFKRIDRVLRKWGKRLDASFALTMLNNDPKFKTYPVATPDAIAKSESEVRERLDTIQHVIAGRFSFQEADIQGVTFPTILPVRIALEWLVRLGMAMVERTGVTDYFYADEKCTRCGTCEKVCSSRKVCVTGEGPVWQDRVKCYFCYACLNYCPTQAVQIKSKWYMKSYTKRNGRYPHPWATVKDIAGQKDRANPGTPAAG